MSKNIFISYRRRINEEQGYIRFVEHFKDLLVEYFGEVVFFDRATIGAGDIFPDVLKEHASQCQIMIILISESWERHFQNIKMSGEVDFVLHEIICAAKSDQNVTFYPILIDREEDEGRKVMPSKNELPEELANVYDRIFKHHALQYSSKIDSLSDFIKQKLTNKIIDTFPSLVKSKIIELDGFIFNSQTINSKDVLGDRANLENKYNEEFYFTRDIDDDLLDIFQRNSYPKIIITGKSMSGKTRAIYQFLKNKLPLIDKDKNYDILVFNHTNIGKFNQVFSVNNMIETSLSNPIIIIDELYKCATVSDLQKFEQAFTRISTNNYKIITTCTLDEYDRLKKDEDSIHNKIIWPKLELFKKFKIKPLSPKEKLELKKYYGLNTNEEDTIGETLGVDYPWKAFNVSQQDGYTKEILKAIQRFGYIKKGNIKVRDIFEYLKGKVRNRDISQFQRSNILNVEGIDESIFTLRSLIIPLKILSNAGIIYCNEFFVEDTLLAIDDSYRDNYINNIPFQKIKRDVIQIIFSNKNLARLISHRNCDETTVQELVTLERVGQDDIRRVYNSYAKKMFSNFSDLKSFYSEKKLNHDIYSLILLSLYCKRNEDLKFILEECETMENILTSDVVEDYRPQKISILNILLNSFSEEEIAINHPCHDKKDFSLLDYFNYDVSTHINNIKNLKNKHDIYLYIIDRKLESNYAVISYVVGKYTLTLDKYIKLINNFNNFSRKDDVQDLFDKTVILFNKSLKTINYKVENFYDWGINNGYVDYISKNLFLGKANNKVELLESWIEDEDLVNVKLLNSCIRHSNSFKEAMAFFNKIAFPDDRTFNFLAEKISKEDNYSTLILLMQKYKHIHFEYTYASLIKKRIKMGISSIDIYGELFKDQLSKSRLNSVMLNELITASKSYSEVDKILNCIKGIDIQKDVDFYNALFIAESKYKEEICEQLNKRQIGDIIRQRITDCEKIDVDNYFYCQVLGNDFYKEYHDRFFNEYVKKLVDGHAKFEFLIVKNFVRDKKGFYEITTKLKAYPSIYNRLTRRFFNGPQIICSSNDIDEVAKYHLERNIIFPGILILNIVKFKKKAEKDFNAYEYIRSLIKVGLLGDAYEFNFICKQDDIVPKKDRFIFIKKFFDDYKIEKKWIKPDRSTYSYWISYSESYEIALKCYKEFCDSNLKGHHFIYTSLLHKTESIKIFKDHFLEFEDKIFNSSVRIKQKDINSIFHKWSELVNKIESLYLREVEKSILASYKEKHGYRQDSIEISLENKFGSYSIKESLSNIINSDHRNIKSYNSLFSRCNTVDEVQEIYLYIQNDFMVIPDFSTITNLFSCINRLKVGGNYFEYFKCSFIEFLNTGGRINYKTKTAHDFIGNWLIECICIDEFRLIAKYFNGWKIKYYKNYWMTDWYNRIISSIKTVDEANFFFNMIDKDWVSHIQIKHLLKQLDSFDEKLEFFNGKDWNWNAAYINPIFEECRNFNDFRKFLNVSPGLKIQNKHYKDWYKDIRKSIYNSEQGQLFFTHLIDQTIVQAKPIYEEIKDEIEKEKFKDFLSNFGISICDKKLH